MATLAITYTPASPTPSLGYRVFYRKVGTITYTQLLPNWTGSSPVLINTLTDGQFEGTIESECSSGFFSTPVSFVTTLTYNYILSPAFNLSISSVIGSGVPSLAATTPTSNRYGNHTGLSGSLSITLAGTIVTTTKLVIYKNNVVYSCIAVPSVGTYNLSIIATTTDVVRIAVNSGVC